MHHPAELLQGAKEADINGLSEGKTAKPVTDGIGIPEEQDSGGKKPLKKPMMKLKAKETFVNIGESEFSGTAVQQLLKDLRRS